MNSWVQSSTTEATVLRKSKEDFQSQEMWSAICEKRFTIGEQNIANIRRLMAESESEEELHASHLHRLPDVLVKAEESEKKWQPR